MCPQQPQANTIFSIVCWTDRVDEWIHCILWGTTTISVCPKLLPSNCRGCCRLPCSVHLDIRSWYISPLKGDRVFRYTSPRVFEQGLGEEVALLEVFRFTPSVLLLLTNNSRHCFWLSLMLKRPTAASGEQLWTMARRMYQWKDLELQLGKCQQDPDTYWILAQ